MKPLLFPNQTSSIFFHFSFISFGISLDFLSWNHHESLIKLRAYQLSFLLAMYCDLVDFLCVNSFFFSGSGSGVMNYNMRLVVKIARRWCSSFHEWMVLFYCICTGILNSFFLFIYQDHKCIIELKDFLFKACSDQKLTSDLKLWLGKKALNVGLLASQHVFNLPYQLLPPLYDALFDEVSWATEDEVG